MYFYSALNEEDKIQTRLLEEAERSNVYCFAMKSSEHGYTLFNNCYKNVLSCPVQKLIQIHSKYKNNIISLRKICFHFMNASGATWECINDVIRCHKSLQRVVRLFRKN